MPLTRVGEHELYYEIRGDGPGEPALLLMGLGTDLEAWEKVAPALGAHRRLLLVDNRGVGRSAKPRGEYSTAEMADDAAAVMADAGIERAHVIGISLGGAIAQELALRHPGRVRSLALIATFANLDRRMRDTAADGATRIARNPTADMLRTMQAMADGDMEIDPRAIFGFLMPLVFSKSFLEKERALLRSMYERSLAHGLSLRGFAGQLAAAWKHDTLSRLHAIRVPTLVITGTGDRLVPPHQSKLIHEAIPHSRYVEIAGGVHGLVLEGVDELNRMLEGWLEEND
jgi:pimeloyl-ACP methyl ester carboxylesterase